MDKNLDLVVLNFYLSMYGVYEINIYVYNVFNLMYIVGEGVKGVGINICIIE